MITVLKETNLEVIYDNKSVKITDSSNMYKDMVVLEGVTKYVKLELLTECKYYIGSDIEALYLYSMCPNIRLIYFKGKKLSLSNLEKLVNDSELLSSIEILKSYVEDLKRTVGVDIPQLNAFENVINNIQNKDNLLKLSEKNIDKHKQKVDLLLNEYSNLLEEKKSIREQLSKLENVFSYKNMEKIIVGSNRPYIITIKVVQEIIHLSSFVDTLYHLAHEQCLKETKIVFLNPNDRKLSINGFKKLGNKWSQHDFVKYNKINKIGENHKFLTNLVNNIEETKLLIIFDLQNLPNLLVSDYNLYMCRNIKLMDSHLHKLTISNTKSSDLYWGTIKNYRKNDFSSLVNTKIMRQFFLLINHKEGD